LLGQKVNPMGLRINLTKDYKSIWYSKFYNYKILLQEDYIIRNFIKKLREPSETYNITIKRNGIGNFVQLNIETEKPNFFIEYGIDNLVKNIKKLIPLDRQVSISLTKITSKNLTSVYFSNLLVKQLENRITFKRAMRSAFKKSEEINLKGIKIQISGRLNGSDIARSEWIKKGKLPLHTLKASIDYSEKQARTIYGILGVKVWLFKNKKNN
jgi:small subunit ribosomal protein S3